MGRGNRDIEKHRLATCGMFALGGGTGFERTGGLRRPPMAHARISSRCRQRLARGWNTWDVHSVTTQVLLPEGLAIHVGMKHNTTLNGDAFLGDALIGRLDKDAEVVTPGPHAWDGSYTDLRSSGRGKVAGPKRA